MKGIQNCEDIYIIIDLQNEKKIITKRVNPDTRYLPAYMAAN